MNIIASWKKFHTASDWIRLAKMAGTTVGTLNQLAGGYRKGGFRVTSGLAARIERASAKIYPILDIPRTVLSPVCRGCEFAAHCHQPLTKRKANGKSTRTN